MKSFSVGLRSIIKITILPPPANSSLFHLVDTLALSCYTGRIIDFLCMCLLSQSLGMPSLVSVHEAFSGFCKPKHSEELGFVETGSPLSFAPSPAKAVSLGYRTCLSSLNQLPWILPWYLGSNPLYFAFLYKISLAVFWKELCNQGKNSGNVKTPKQNSTISFCHYSIVSDHEFQMQFLRTLLVMPLSVGFIIEDLKID